MLTGMARCEHEGLTRVVIFCRSSSRFWRTRRADALLLMRLRTRAAQLRLTVSGTPPKHDIEKYQFSLHIDAMNTSFMLWHVSFTQKWPRRLCSHRILCSPRQAGRYVFAMGQQASACPQILGRSSRVRLGASGHV